MTRTRANLILIGLAAAASTVGGLGAGWADNGYYGGTLGPRAAGRSGAVVARADDPTAIAHNPAGLSNIRGTTVLLGNRFSHNGYSYTRAPTLDWGNVSNGMAPLVSFDRVSNSGPWQLLDPLLALAIDPGLDRWRFAVGAYAPPGTRRMEFPLDGGQRYMMVGREAIILNYTVSAAWRPSEVFAMGATARWISVPRLNHSLVIDGSPFAQDAHPVSSPLDMLASTQGSDPFTLGGLVGAWYRPHPFLDLGFGADIIPSTVSTTSRLSVTPLGADVGAAELTRHGVPANDVSVKLPLPTALRFGGRYRHLDGTGTREIFDVELDIEYTSWFRTNDFVVDTRGLEATVRGATVDLGRIVVPKRWRDTVTMKLGGDYVVVPDRVALRAGLFYETAVAAPAYANVDFPGGAMFGGSFGGSVLFDRWEIAFAYQIRQQATVNVTEREARVYQQVPASPCAPPYTDPAICNPNYLGQPSPAVNAGTYRARFHYLALALLYRFGG